mgnify:FL=1
MIVFFENNFIYYPKEGNYPLLKSIEMWKNLIALDDLIAGNWYRLEISINDTTYLAKFEKNVKE